MRGDEATSSPYKTTRLLLRLSADRNDTNYNMETTVYRSKISYWLVALITLIILGVMVTMIVVKAFSALIIDMLIIAVFIHLFATTYYTITGNTLKVRCSFMVINIDIATITKIENTNSVLSAPALSMDRIEVFYNKYDSMVISPGDKAGFITRLKEMNPEIKTG